MTTRTAMHKRHLPDATLNDYDDNRSRSGSARKCKSLYCCERVGDVDLPDSEDTSGYKNLWTGRSPLEPAINQRVAGHCRWSLQELRSRLQIWSQLQQQMFGQSNVQKSWQVRQCFLGCKQQLFQARVQDHPLAYEEYANCAWRIWC